MKTRVQYLFAAVLILSACSSKDEAFCTCLQKGDEFNEASRAFIESGEGDEKTLLELKKQKDDACTNYSDMSGEEMLKRKKDCGIED